MTTSEIFISLLFFIGSLILTFSLGLFVINTIILSFEYSEKKFNINLTTLTGLSILIGLGVFGYLGLVIGLLGQFKKEVIFLFILIIFALTSKQSYIFLKRYIYQIAFFISSLKKDYISLIIITGIIFLVSGLFLISLQPPYANDELSYHIPQAEQIVNSKTVSLNFGGHFFYGNIPKLMEIIFAEGIAIHGYIFSHLLHFSFLIGFLLTTGGILNSYYNKKTALLAILLLLIYYDFTWNATLAYIDAGNVILEISSLLIFVDWLIKKHRISLFICSILIGLSLSIKYSALFTFIFILSVILIILIKNKKTFSYKTIKEFSLSGLLVLLFSGFWYIKNLFLFKNPFYPLYFGHAGIEEMEYLSLIQAIQQFGPRTLEGFFAIPIKFLVFLNIPVFISFYTAPLSILIEKSRNFHSWLFIYYCSYIIYWFFIATHQTRFLMPAIVVGFILTSIVISNILESKKNIIIFFLFLFSIIIIFNTFSSNFNQKITFSEVYKFYSEKIKYGLGKETKSDFLRNNLGCQYSVLEFLDSGHKNGNIIDNWHIWDVSADFYARNNKFLDYKFLPGSSVDSIKDGLQKKDIRYIYFKTTIKNLHLVNSLVDNQDSLNVEYLKDRESSEEYLLKKSQLIYTEEPCELYQINFDQLTEKIKEI